MQILHSSNSVTNAADNYIEGFLIGTKKNANGWQISKSTLPKLVNGFIGKPFTIIPEKLAHGIDAHFHGATKQETIDGYNAYSHGAIEKILGPFLYDDSPGDFYYKHITRLSNSKSASLLAEYGAKTKTPFAVSPHIWQEDVAITDYVYVFTPIGVSLVGAGAYGDIAVINKLCQGTADTCHRSLGADHSRHFSIGENSCGCCENTDENVARIVSSLFSKSASFNSNSIVSTVPNTNPVNTQTQIPIINPNANPTLEPQKQLTTEPQTSDRIVLTKEQYDKIQEERKEFESTKTRLEILENEHKTNVLTSIFAPDLVTDETTRNNLIEKWKNADIKTIKDLYQDISASILPALIEKAKLEAAKTTTAAPAVEDKKSKSAATLKPEPKVPCGCKDGNESKTAATVTEAPKTNEVQLLRKYLFGGR